MQKTACALSGGVSELRKTFRQNQSSVTLALLREGLFIERENGLLYTYYPLSLP